MTAPERLAPVQVVLSEAAVAWSKGTLTVHCRLTLINRTGRRLRALSNFNTLYDGFSLEVRGPHGGLVARQSAVFHHSPYAVDRALPVDPGETTGTLQFPITVQTRPVGPLEVQLVGGLRGTRWVRSRPSNVVVAKWTK